MRHAAHSVLYESVLLQLARRDVVPVDATLFRPLQNCYAGRLDTRKNLPARGAVCFIDPVYGSRGIIMRQAGLFGLSEHLDRLSKDGEPLEVLAAPVDFEDFRPWLAEGLGYGDGSKGGRPPLDPVSMFKALILKAQHNRFDARMKFMPVGICCAIACRPADPR